jgi:hypothetical protein
MIVIPWQQRPHPSWCSLYDPCTRCDCAGERKDAEILELRAALAKAKASA